MTQKQILHLAYLKAIDLWAYEDDLAEKLPDNKYARARAQKAWNDVKEISEMLKAEEDKEN